MRIRSGSININTNQKVFLGCSDFVGETSKIEGELESNFIILSTENAKVVIISIDTLYVGAQLRSLIERKLCGNFESEEIFIAASHTHTAPMVDVSKPKFGAVNEKYLHELANKISTSILNSLENDATNIEIKNIQYFSEQVSNRRKWRIVGGKNRKIVFLQNVMSPNLKDKLRPPASLLIFHENGIPSAAIWNFACHPTSSPWQDAQHPNFIGDIRLLIRKKFSKDIPIVFLQGLSGDLRPPAYNITHASFKQSLIRIFLGARYRNFSEIEYTAWCGNLWHEIEENLNSNGFNQNTTNLSISRKSMKTAIFFDDHKPDSEFSIHMISLGDLAILGISAELVSEWQEEITKLFSDVSLILVSCIDDTFGYLPTRKIMKQGGYEAGEYTKFFGLPNLAKETPTKFLEFLSSLQNQNNSWS